MYKSFECIKAARNSCNHKHLRGNWTPKTGLSNTSDLQPTKLVYKKN